MTARQWVAISVSLIGASMHPGAARAADDDLTALLSEPVETTSSKSAGTAASAPALSMSITAEDLRRYGIRTLAEAYNFLTMGLVSEDPLSEPEVGGRGLIFSGTQNKHLLLLIDGHSTNDQESGASLHGHELGLSLELIDHVEVMLGPGSVLYGSNAMLGVVNVVTKRAKDYSGIHAVVTGAYAPPINRAHAIVPPTLASQYGKDIGKEHRFMLGGAREFELRGLPAELIAGVEYYTMDGPTMEWGPQIRGNENFGPRAPIGSWGGQTRNSYYAQVPSGYGRFIVGDFEAALHVVKSRLSQPYLRRKDQPLSGGNFDDPDSAKERTYAGLELKWRHNLSTTTAVLARVYGDLTTETFKYNDVSFFGCLDTRPDIACARTEEGYARWAGSELQWTRDWTGNGRMMTMIGTDARVRHNGYQNGSTEIATGRRLVYSFFSATETAAAVYAQHVVRILKWLTMNGGIRWDVDNRFGNRLSPRAAIIAEPWAGGTIKTIYSQAFRAPTTDELNYRNPMSTLASQGLSPESARSIEAVLQQRFGTQNIVFGVYRSWLNDMIVRHELRDLVFQVADADSELVGAAKRAGLLSSVVQLAYQYRNVASIDDFGFNGGYDGTLVGGRLTYGMNLTASYARLNTPEGIRRVSVTPTMFGNARVSFDLSNRLPVVAFVAHFSDRRLSNAGEDARFVPVPYAPAAIDLRGNLTGPFPRVRGLSYQVMGNYAFGSSNPYTAGPGSLNPALQPSPELIPSVRFTLMFGLQYDLNFRP